MVVVVHEVLRVNLQLKVALDRNDELGWVLIKQLSNLWVMVCFEDCACGLLEVVLLMCTHLLTTSTFISCILAGI